MSEADKTDLKETVFKVMLYNRGKIDYSLCFNSKCCVSSFTRKGPDGAFSSYKLLKFTIIIVLLINVAVQTALSVLDIKFNNSLYANMPVQDIID